MQKTGRTLRLVSVAGLVLGLVGAMVVLAPDVQGQTTRSEPLNIIRTQIFGGPEIGVSLRDVDDADLRREGLDSLAGAVVEDVRRDGPAAEAGFRAGDVVVAFDGERVRSARHLARLIEETPEGREVATTVVRAGERRDLTVAPVAPEPLAFASNIQPLAELRNFNFEFPEELDRFRFDSDGATTLYNFLGRRRLGVSVIELTDQLASHFDVSSGVFVTSVDDDTPASRAGLEAGDVITRVGGEAVRSPTDLRQRLSRSTGEVTIEIVRDGEARTLRADIGSREPVREVRRIRK